MRPIQISLVVFAAALGAFGCATAPSPDGAGSEDDLASSSPKIRFEALSSGGKPYVIEELLVRRKVPGLSVAVIRNYEIAWAQGYGIADVQTGTAVTKDTLFQAASISKPISAMAEVRAVQDGVFGLDDNINDLLRSWKLPENSLTDVRPVTPRMLLSHTGGTTVHGFSGYHPSDSIPTVPQLLSGEAPANSGAVVVDVEPGTQWRYSGGGTTVMQLAMTDLFQKPFSAIVKELVLDPIGMSSSAYDQPLSPERDRIAARAHDGRGEAMDAKWHVYPELQAAGLWTTPSDLCRFAIELMNAYRGEAASVLDSESARLMLTPVKPGAYGLGLSVAERVDGTWAGHGGSNWGFRCDLAFNLDTGDGFCIMTNGETGSVVMNEVRRRLAAVYAQ